MQMPAVQDTIVAVSSAWQPAPVGIIRLSGADAFVLLARVTAEPLRPGAHRAVCTDERLCVGNGCELPATIFSFRAPRSYTGQDVVEIHTVGCLPLLRELSAHLIELGARRALPGEFTARAFLNGKLDARQVEAVLALMQAEHEAGLRQAARLSRSTDERLIAAVRERIIALLALIEAGIDFVEEDDVHFISAEEVARTLDESFVDLAVAGVGPTGEFRGHKPHVALVGLPNAGKSTLFNVLIGTERALVSPVLGTTRDVLSAELEIEGVSIVVQDCAGLGEGADELELATHVATERAAQQADVVAWVHAANTGWDEREAATCRRIPPERRVLVQSKMDLASQPESATEPQPPPIPFAATVAVSAAQATGIGKLRSVIAERVDSLSARVTGGPWQPDLRAAEAALRRAQALARTTASELVSPELVALELRAAVTMLTRTAHGPLDEELLERIYSQFCVGK